MEERANRLAHHLAAHGVGPGDHVGIYALQLRRVGRDAVGRLQAPRRVDQHQLPLRRGRARLPLRQRRPEGARLPARVRAAGARACSTACRCSTHSIVIEDGSGADLAGLGSVDYEDAMAERLARARLRAALRRRPLHPLHRRHDRHAQGRRVAPRGRVLRARRRHRPGHERAGRPPEAHGREGAWRAPAVHDAADRAAHARRHAVGRDGRRASVGNKIVLVAEVRRGDGVGAGRARRR